MRYTRIINISPTKTLVLKRTLPHLDECRVLLSKVVKQARTDFLNFFGSEVEVEREIYEEVVDFLFDDECYIDWGGREMNLKDILDLLGIDLIWYREKVLRDLYASDPEGKKGRNK